MCPTLGSLITLFKLSFFLLAICLTILNINERYNTNKISVSTYAVDRSKIDFPISFSIIVNPGLKDLFSNGYSYWEHPTSGYYRGESKFGNAHFGWAGHTKEGGIISNVSGNINLKRSKTKDLLLKYKILYDGQHLPKRPSACLFYIIIFVIQYVYTIDELGTSVWR